MKFCQPLASHPRRVILVATVAAIFFGPAHGLTAQDPLFDKTKVKDLHFTFKQANWWNTLLATQTNKIDMKADLVVDNVTYKDVGVRVKGNTSARASATKKPFNISMDAFVVGQKLHGYKTINLNNAYVDPTFTREVLTYDLFRNYMPAPQTGYARVYLNNTLWGVYVMVEQLNKDFLGAWYKDTGGDRYKGDPPGGAALRSATLTWRGTSASSYQNYYEIKTPTHPNAWKDLVTLCDKLNNTPANTFRSVIEQYLDVDQALWYIACCNVVHNLDSYINGGHNYYMYFDPADGRMNMLVWDCNMSFGVFAGGTNAYRLSPLSGSGSTTLPLSGRLLADPEYREIYLAHIRTILDEVYEWDKKMAVANTAYQNLIRSAVQSDTNKLYPMSVFDSNITTNYQNRYIMPGLKTLVDARRAFLLADTEIKKPTPTISDVTMSATRPQPKQELFLTAKVTASPGVHSVFVRASAVGAFVPHQMYDDGKHRDGVANDGVYGGSFKAGNAGELTRFYVLARSQNNTVELHPRRAEHEFLSVRVWPQRGTGPVLINELLADNDTGDKDEAGDNDDWVELHNTSTTAYDLSGHYLSDDLLKPKKWQFPSGTTIPAGGFLRVWADEEPTEGKLHAGFKLNQNGEELGLFDVDTHSNALLDAVIFGSQKGDRSYGCVPDGGKDFYYVWEPSGNAPLLGSATSVGRAVRFDTRRTGSPSSFDLKTSGTPQASKSFNFELENGPQNAVAILGLSLGTSPFDLGPLGTLLLSTPTLVPVFLKLDATGKQTLGASVPAGLAGSTIYAQAISNELTNAVVVRFSK